MLYTKGFWNRELFDCYNLRFFDKELPIMKPQTITFSVTTENEPVLIAGYKITGK